MARKNTVNSNNPMRYPVVGGYGGPWMGGMGWGYHPWHPLHPWLSWGWDGGWGFHHWHPWYHGGWGFHHWRDPAEDE
jgi:hypothetical protein